jgi:hypothetical protein
MLFCSFLIKVIFSLFWGCFWAVTGYMLAVFLAKGINRSFRLNLLHYLLCGAIAIFTLVVFQFLTVARAGLKYIDQGAAIMKTELAENHYLQQQIKSTINQSQHANEGSFTELLKIMNNTFEEKYPAVKNVIDFDVLKQSEKLSEILTRSQIDVDNNTKLVEAFADYYISELRDPVAHTRTILVVLIAAIQLFQISVLMLKAKRTDFISYNFHDTYIE